jgi:hypothetical protein
MVNMCKALSTYPKVLIIEVVDEHNKLVSKLSELGKFFYRNPKRRGKSVIIDRLAKCT